MLNMLKNCNKLDIKAMCHFAISFKIIAVCHFTINSTVVNRAVHGVLAQNALIKLRITMSTVPELHLDGRKILLQETS